MFSLEEVYGVDRNTYCKESGISKRELVRHLELEVMILKRNLDRVSEEFRSGGAVTETIQVYRANLITHIQSKIDRKTEKIKDIERNMQWQMPTMAVILITIKSKMIGLWRKML